MSYSTKQEAEAGHEGQPGIAVQHTDGSWTWDGGADAQAAYFAQQNTEMASEALGTQSAIAEGQLAISQQQQDIANEQWDLYKSIYEPVEKAWADAALAGLPADQFVTKAVADVEQSYVSQKGQMQRDLARYGIDPSSPEYASITANLDIAEAAAKAGAATNTRMAINDVNYSRMSDVVKTGRGVPTESASTLAGASNTASQASGAYNSGYNAVMQANQALSSMYNSQYQQNEANKAATQGAMYGAIGSLVGTAAGVGIGVAAT